jgi:hypothetical protein
MKGCVDMKIHVIKFAGIMMVSGVVFLAGCEKKSETRIAGSAESAGAALDKAADKVAEAAEDFADKAVKKTGEALEKAGAAMEKTGAEMQE